MTSKLAFCELHGGYDAGQYAACPGCRKAAAAAPPAQPRISQLDTLQAGEARRTARQREGTTTRGQVGRTTAHGGRRPSQLQTQRPRFAPVGPFEPSPSSTRLHGWAAVGLCALVGALGYSQWSKVAPSSGASSGFAAAAGLDAGAAPPPPSAAANGREAARFADKSEGAQPARAWPVIRYRARPERAPDICSVPWLEMYERPRVAADRSGSGPHGQTPLMVAAESGSVEELQRLLGSGANVDERDALNHTALTYAARGGRNAHVELLMRAGADARTRGLWDLDGGSMTALDAALLVGAIPTARLMEREVLQSFLALEAPDLSAVDEAGDTPLHWVARYADARAAQSLVERGAHLETRNCPARPGDERGVHGDDLRSATPLLVAVWAGNPAVTRLLLQSRANAAAVDERGRGVFHVMRHAESVSLTADLLRAGADPVLTDRDGKTPAEVLSASGLRTELARALAAAGRPIPSAPATIGDLMGVIKRLGSTRGTTAAEDDPAPVLALLEGDALLVDEIDSQGRTALFEAAFQGLPRVTETLLGRGARVDARDVGGATALHRARDPQTIALLVRLGASVDARDHGGATPLHLRAAAPGSLDAVTALVAAGANTRLENRGNQTALDLAQTSGSADVIEYLERQR